MSSLFDKTTAALGSSLNMRLLRSNVTTANIANAETPGYAAKKVDFEDQLARAIQQEGANQIEATNPGHVSEGRSAIDSIKGDIYDNPEVSVSNDGNTVDIEKEMTTLSENNVLYRAAVELIKKKLGAMRYVATDGGR